MLLHAAIEHGNLNKVKELIDKNKQQKTPADFCYYINEYFKFNETPLQLSLRQEKYKIALLLLENGADPNHYYTANSTNDTKGYSALITAPLLSGRKNLIRLLIFYGASIPDIKFDQQRKSIKTFAYNMLVQANKQKEKLQCATKAESEHDFLAAFLNYKSVADIWNELAQDESNIDFKLHYQEKALALYDLAIICYKKIKGDQPLRQYEAEYNKLISLKENLEHTIEINTVDSLPVKNTSNKASSFFKDFGKQLHRLIHCEENKADPLAAKSLLSKNHHIHNNFSLRP